MSREYFDIRINMMNFGQSSGSHKKLSFTFRYDFATKYLTATQGLIGRIFRLLEILTVYMWYRAWNCHVSILTFG